MAGSVNPYATQTGSRDAGEAPGAVTGRYAHHRYAAPGIDRTNDPTNTDGGYSPEMRPSSDGSALPDDIRIGRREPPVNDPNDFRYSARRDQDRKNRQADEVTTVGWNVQQQKVQAPNVPEWSQERAPIRPTATQSPDGYRFFRQWHLPRNIRDQNGEEDFQRNNISLADHRRTYPILGMRPTGKVGLNTFRLDPRPWDEELIVQENTPSTEVSPLASANAGNRSYRL